MKRCAIFLSNTCSAIVKKNEKKRKKRKKRKKPPMARTMVDQDRYSVLSLLEIQEMVCFVFQISFSIHKMAATLGDSPYREGPAGQLLQSAGSLPHLAKHFSLGFLFLLRAKKPHTNKNLSGLIPPSRHNADFCFHKAKISDIGQRELLKETALQNHKL